MIGHERSPRVANGADPDAGHVPFLAYATAWIDERPGLRPKTIQLYRYLLRAHLKEALALQPWPGSSRLKGASVEKSPERPVLTAGQVYALADSIGPRYRALILLACFGGLRWGELAGLQRADIDCEHRTVRVTRQLCEVPGREPFLAPPKSDAGRRTVSMPSLIVADVSSHLDAFTAPDADSLVFTSPHGLPLRQTNFRRRAWLPALAATGLNIHCTTCAIPVTSSSPRRAPTLVS